MIIKLKKNCKDEMITISRKHSFTPAMAEEEEEVPNGEQQLTLVLSAPPGPQKVAIFLAYLGYGYLGMQRNPNAKTIESDLETALYLSSAIPTPQLRHYDFSRCARTDKGVSAVGQVVSGLFTIDDHHVSFVERLNSHLPPQIRVLGVKVTPKEARFDAKKCCDRRRYVYLLPVFALDEMVHRDRESVVGSSGGLGRCMECSERGRKVPGVMGGKERRSLGNGSCLRNENKLEYKKGPSLENSMEKLRNGECKQEIGERIHVDFNSSSERISAGEKLKHGIGGGGDLQGKQDSCELVNEVLYHESQLDEVKKEYGFSESSRITKVESGNGEATVVNCPSESWRPISSCSIHFGEKQKERFNEILQRYVGYHNFHNLTTRMKAEDPAAWRQILSIDASNVVRIDGMEFLMCKIVGKSFMLHQIRKMIGLAVAVARNCTSEFLVDLALRQDVKINVPTAPDVGLYLEECVFASYNEKWSNSDGEISLTSYVKQVEDFKLRYIYHHISSMEKLEGAVALWLHSLNRRNYPDFQLAEISSKA